MKTASLRMTAKYSILPISESSCEGNSDAARRDVRCKLCVCLHIEMHGERQSNDDGLAPENVDKRTSTRTHTDLGGSARIAVCLAVLLLPEPFSCRFALLVWLDWSEF